MAFDTSAEVEMPVLKCLDMRWAAQHAANVAALSEASGGAAEGRARDQPLISIAPALWAATMRGLEPRGGTRANSAPVRADISVT
jgi:hypothetical protein